MTNHDDDGNDLDFIRRVGDAYAPPPLTPARRTRFDAELETRIARDRWRFLPWGVALATAGAAALLLITRFASVAPVTEATVADQADTDEAFVLALAGGSPDELDAELPADYQAIASLLELR
jgi:hypothetical protein